MAERPHILIRELHKPPQDRIYTGGGGGGTYPRSHYQNHAKKIYKEAEVLKAAFDSIKEKLPVNRLYYRVELPEEFKVWTTDGEKLENDVHSQLVGSPSPNVAHLTTSEDSIGLLLDELNRYGTTETNVGKSKFAIIENIGKIPASEKISDRLKPALKKKDFRGEVLFGLFPDLLREDQAAYIKAIELYLKRGRGRIEGVRESDIGLLLRISATSDEISYIASEFQAVSSVDPLDEIIIKSSQMGEDIADTIEVAPNQSNARACLFDSGVQQNSRFLKGSFLSAEENPMGPPFDVDHGTFVTSRIVFGDSIVDQLSAGQLTPDVKILSINVFPADGDGRQKRPKVDELISVIRDTVTRWHREIRVYNLSLNMKPDHPDAVPTVLDDAVSPLAAELDYLSLKYAVLFVVTTGNYNPNPVPRKKYPEYFTSDETRLVPPAEAMLALTVGSTALRSNTGSMAPADGPSPFTRRGPGFQNYRKPDLIAHGGNLGSRWHEVKELSTVGIAKNGECVGYGVGTSYAAPLITRLAAHLFASLTNASPELVRAILIHSCALKSMEGVSEEILANLAGSGFPSLDAILHSDSWRQNFLFSGSVGYRKIIHIPFYVPESLVRRRRNNKVRISFTVAFSSETARTLRSGYCKSHLRTKVCKIGPNGELIDVSSDDSISNINERYGTLVRGTKSFSRNITHGDWALLVEHQSRWKLESPEVRFGAVISVEDPHREEGIDIYQAIRAEVPNRYTQEIRIRERIRT